MLVSPRRRATRASNRARASTTTRALHGIGTQLPPRGIARTGGKRQMRALRWRVVINHQGPS